MTHTWITAAALAAGFFAAGLATAQDKDSTSKQIERYREALAEGNPAELWEARGEALWKEKRGPKGASLERCDLGLGPGIVKGAYTVLPKYFADTGKVEDLESRLVTCMVSLQGFTPGEAKKDPFGGPGKKVPMDALVAYIASESRGMAMHVSIADPKEREAYELGRQIFFYRGGPHDFACASCHGAEGKRIRLQDLPNLTNPADARKAYTTWPAYRVSQGEVRSMQWRLNDCFRQQRFPELEFTSPASIALSLYLARTAEGGVMDAPAIKR
ncbi:MAG TPA: sulfur oxidation c-type cytochrome SoxA [Usitatibacter sp.]|jgi:sulfur-oxidizing protein SoxA|nr:sulfur oxidation c-type cytochrome SoxA [Usitatibacter sp.]